MPGGSIFSKLSPPIIPWGPSRAAGQPWAGGMRGLNILPYLSRANNVHNGDIVAASVWIGLPAVARYGFSAPGYLIILLMRVLPPPLLLLLLQLLYICITRLQQ